MPARLILYIRQGCHLCDAFMAEMRQFNVALFRRTDIRDVDEDEYLRQQYGEQVPILVADETAICRYFFDASQIKSWLKREGIC